MTQRHVSLLIMKSGFMAVIGLIFMTIGGMMQSNCVANSFIGCPASMFYSFGRLLLFLGIIVIVFVFITKYVLGERKKDYDVIDLHLSSKLKEGKCPFCYRAIGPGEEKCMACGQKLK